MVEVKKSTIEENLKVLQKEFKPVYGDDFAIKPEGVIDGIAVAVSALKLEIEDQILNLKMNMNPYTATGQAQDSLYSLRNMKRRQSTYTKVQRTIEGTPGALIAAGSLLFENAVTKDQFQLETDVTLGENGKVVGTFKSLLIGAVDLPSTSSINIITPLSDVTAVYYTSGNDINIGVEYENNEEFRKQFLKKQNINNRLHLALLDLVDNPGDLRIIQNRGRQVYPEIPLHTKQITIYSAESDQKIAQTIFDNMVDGSYDLDGDIAVEITDDSGEVVEIRFNRATPVNVYVKTLIVKNPANTDAEAKADGVTAISDYYNNNSFVMGEKVVANRFNAEIDAKKSISYPVETLVSSDGISYIPVLSIGKKEVPVFAAARITVVLDEED